MDKVVFARINKVYMCICIAVYTVHVISQNIDGGAKEADGGATEADGGASAPVGPSVATPLGVDYYSFASVTSHSEIHSVDYTLPYLFWASIPQ